MNARFEDNSDTELVQLTRQGSVEAFAELWRRHSRAARNVALASSSSLDADDLVAESFTKVYVIIGRGDGPTEGFRSYLFTTIRNTAASWGRALNETSIDEIEDIESGSTSEGEVFLSVDRSLSARAFKSLPPRWQQALWYSEVEGMSHRQISEILKIKPTAVAMLTFRAREALRQAWIQAHIAERDSAPDCRWAVRRLGGFTRRALSKRDTKRLEGHLDGCNHCTKTAAEAKIVGSQLAIAALPVGVGLFGVARLHGSVVEEFSVAVASHGNTLIGAAAFGISRATTVISTASSVQLELMLAIPI